MYFGLEVDDAIERFKNEQDPKIKEKIFTDEIRPPMMKLIENLMYLKGFYKIDDPDTLASDALAALYETIPKFDPSKGTKAFSYFNVVTRNWFISKIREKKKRSRQIADTSYSIDHDIVKNDSSVVLSSHEDEVIEKEFKLSLFRNMEKWRSILKKKQELQVLDAIVFLMQNPDLVSIYSKKAVFVYIKEMTNLTTKQVNHHMTRLKELYIKFREEFNSGEEQQQQEQE